MKTIFFLLPTGITVRNFLSTGVISRLLTRDDLRVVAFTGTPEIADGHPQESEGLVLERLPKRGSSASTRFLHAVLRSRFHRMNATSSTKILAKGPISGVRGTHLRSVLSQPFSRNETLYRWLRALEESLGGVSREVRDFY